MVNDLIFQRLVTVFSAVVDAAVFSNNWIVIDRLGSKSVRLYLSIRSLSIHLYLCIYIYFDNIHLYVCMYIFIYLAAVVDAAVFSNNWIVIDRLGSKSVRLYLSIRSLSLFISICVSIYISIIYIYMYVCIYLFI